MLTEHFDINKTTCISRLEHTSKSNWIWRYVFFFFPLNSKHQKRLDFYGTACWFDIFPIQAVISCIFIEKGKKSVMLI